MDMDKYKDLEKKTFIDEILNHDWGKVSPERKKELSNRGKPAFQLDKILEGKTVRQLREIADKRMIPEYNGMKKIELINKIKKDIFEDDYFYSDLIDLDSTNYEFLSYLVSVDFLEENNLPIEAYEKLVLLGFAGLYELNGKFKLIVSHEVKSLFNKMEKEEMNDIRYIKTILHIIANAAVNLYGFISLEDFAEIYERITGVKYDKNYLDDMLEDTQYTEDLDFYEIEDGYILHSALKFIGDENAKHIINTAKGKPRYIPTKEEFLLHANPAYLELGHGLDGIIKLLSKYVSEIDMVFLIGDLKINLTMNISHEDIIRMIEEYGINFRPNDIIKLKKLLAQTRDNFRLWANKGYSTNDIKMLFNPNIKLLSSYQK